MPRWKDLEELETGEPIDKYECVFIINPELEKTILDAIVNRYKKVARGFQEHVKIDVWGEKKLAYPIKRDKKNYKSGYYVRMCFDATNDQADELQRTFNTDDTILKHICVKHDDPDFEYEDDPITEDEKSEQPDLNPDIKSAPVDVFNLIFKIDT